MKSVVLQTIRLSLIGLFGATVQMATFAGEPEFLFEETISSNFDGLPNSSLRQFSFVGPASLRIERQADGTTEYCLEVFERTTCGHIDRLFDQTSLVYFEPHCQTGAYALEFALIGEEAPDQSIYYVDGRVTIDLAVAESWIASDPACIITGSDSVR